MPASEETSAGSCYLCGWDMEEDMEGGFQTASRSLHPAKKQKGKMVCSHCAHKEDSKS